jgi:hypothetical protein
MTEKEIEAVRGILVAYQRRVRSACISQEQIDKRPWDCAEYGVAMNILPEDQRHGL